MKNLIPRAALTALFVLLLAIPSWGGSGATSSDEGYKPIDPVLFFGNKAFTTYEENLRISFEISKRADVGSFSGVFLEIESNDNRSREILIDWDSEYDILDFFLVSGNIVSKYYVRASRHMFDEGPVQVMIDMDFRKDLVELIVGGRTVFMHDVGLSINKRYRLSVLPHLSSESNPNLSPVLLLGNMEVSSTKIPARRSVWYWFVLIIAVDIIIYLLVWVPRRRRMNSIKKIAVASAGSHSFRPEELPRVSAIHIFGELHVYDSEGENITKRFSPLLRELLAVLVVYSADKGVSSDKLRELLWPDKEAVSARNNRAVYIGRLRSLLDSLGAYELNNKSGAWLFQPSGIFVDYLEYRSIPWSEEPVREHVEKFMSLVQAGNLLPETDFRWLDKYKAELASDVIEKLIGYARTLDLEKMPDFAISVSDTIFRFDNLNEQALYLKCKAFQLSGRHSLAKTAFDIFAEEYNEVYGRKFSYQFTQFLDEDILSAIE